MTTRSTFCFGATREARLSIRAIVEAAPRDAHLYCCGPGRMIEDFLDACAARPAAQVHFERFSASSEAATEGGFEVVLKKSGQRFAIAPGKTILDTLLDHAGRRASIPARPASAAPAAPA